MANEKRLIELDALIDSIDWDNDLQKWTLRGEPEDIPTVDAAPVVQGRWKRRGRNLGECSECGEVVMVRYPYCPNCGANMRGSEE